MLETIITTWKQPEVLRLVGLSALSILFWHAPVLGLLFYPFRLLTTFVHELSHGLAAMMTGGEFHRFTVHPNREGLAHIRGGNQALVTSAGYLGTALFGGGLILLSATSVRPTTLLMGLGGALAVGCVLFVRNLFGVVAGLLLAGALFAAGWYLPEGTAAWVFAALALQLPLSALDTLVDLVRIALRPQRRIQPSDAHRMAQLTGIPAALWAVLWAILALAIVVGAVTLAYRGGV